MEKNSLDKKEKDKLKLLLNDEALNWSERYGIALQHFSAACHKKSQDKINYLLASPILSIKVDIENLTSPASYALVSNEAILEQTLDFVQKKNLTTPHKHKKLVKNLFKSSLSAQCYDSCQYLLKTYPQWFDLSLSPINVRLLKALNKSMKPEAYHLLKFICASLPDPEKYLALHEKVPQNFKELEEDFKLAPSILEILTICVERKEFSEKLKALEIQAHTKEVNAPLAAVKKKKSNKI